MAINLFLLHSLEDSLKQLEHVESASDSTGCSLLDLFAEITADMTEDEVAQLPKDGAEQHDHYIYGTLKNSAANR